MILVTSALLASPATSEAEALKAACTQRTHALEVQGLRIRQLEDEVQRMVTQLAQKWTKEGALKLRIKILEFGHQKYLLGQIQTEQTFACELKIEWTQPTL